MLGIIFDCDGVLVDSEKWSCRAWLPVLARRGIQAGLDEIEPFIGKSDQAVLDYFHRKTGRELGGDILEEREEQYFALARGRLQSFGGLPEVLENLRGRDLPLAVASSGRPTKIHFSLKEVGLDTFFDTICSAVEVERGKPAPDLFLLAAEKLGLEAGACAVVEDSVFGLQAARAAHMLALGFSSSHGPEVLLEAGAHRAFSSYRDFLPLLHSLGKGR